MTRQTHGHGYYCQSRVGVTRSRKHGTACDIQSAYAENFTVAIDDAGFWRIGHTRRSNMVEAVAEFAFPGVAGLRKPRLGLHFRKTQPFKLGTHSGGHDLDAMAFAGVEPPVDLSAKQAEGVAIWGQGDAAIGVRLLLGVALQKNAARLAERRLTEEISTGGCASDFGQMPSYALDVGHQIRRQHSMMERAIDFLERRDARIFGIFKDQVRSAVQSLFAALRGDAQREFREIAERTLVLQGEEIAKRANVVRF